MAERKNPAEGSAGALVRATVAPRRTLAVGEETKGPGSEVELPEAEVTRLRKLGFLVDPNAGAPAPVGDGPSFTAA